MKVESIEDVDDTLGNYFAKGPSLSGRLRIVQLGKLKWQLRFDSPVSDRLSKHSKIAFQLQSHRTLTPASAELLLKVLDTEQGYLLKLKSVFAREGALLERAVSKRERNPAVRRAALRKYGTKCMICGFDFIEIYGDWVCECVEIHHLDPLGDRPKRKENKTQGPAGCLP